MLKVTYKIKYILLFSIAMTLTLVASAQDVTLRSVNRSTLIGIGGVSLYDTYLSPSTYSGLSVSLLSERINATHFFNDKLLLQQQFFLQTGFTENSSSTGNEYYGDVSYRASLLYPLARYKQLRVLGGGGGEITLGGIYNQRNSNNPGALKTSFNINLQAMAIYNWRMLTFRWQLTSPIVGMFFSPGYGQSYYEIFLLGNGAGTIMLGSPFNQLILQNYFTVVVPVGNFTIRTGYLGRLLKTDVNNITTKVNSHQFMIGLAMESLNFGGTKAKNRTNSQSCYY